MKKTIFYLFMAWISLSITACKKADEFKDKLSALPQVDYKAHAYKTTYIVGDTMVVIGRLQPKNDLQITIGGIPATIIKVDSVLGEIVNVNQQPEQTYEDRVSVLISPEMTGLAKEVKITTGGFSLLGTAITVYTYGGEGSFNSILNGVQVSQTTLSNSYKFLYAVTGKGDVYYYAPGTKDLRHITKDGSGEIIYDLSGLGISSFLAGGVDPQGQNLYFSVQLNSGYGLYKLNLQNQTLTVLNSSAGISIPYEGAVASVQMIVTGIYPDAKGNLYLGIGTGNAQGVPDAVAHYNIADKSIKYIFNGITGKSYTGMPGLIIPTTNSIEALRFSPDEDLMYSVEVSSATDVIKLYDLSAHIFLQEVHPNFSSSSTITQYDAVAPFSGLQIKLKYGADNSFGYLPMPGKRLQVLLYQNYAQGANYGFPKWIVFDFINKRTYAYALGKFQQGDNGQYVFRESDQLLNYDEGGNLYMTGNGISYLLKTNPIN